MKRKLYILIYLFLSFCFFSHFQISNALANNKASPMIVGEAGLVMEVKTGTILYEKNAHRMLEPASTTKIMTAILALERGNLTDIVKADEESTLVDGSSIGLKNGEKLTLEEMLYAMMLNSGNDASIAIAKHIAGDVPTFVNLMNKKANEIGAKNTNFINPNGLPDKNHYTTAYDLALISRYAMLNLPKFREIVSTKTMTIPWQGESFDRQLVNHNKLLWNYKGANGIKTGYTSSAGQTIVASASRNNQELIAVVLKSQGRNIRSDAKKLLNYGFENFKTIDIIEKQQYVTSIDARYGGKFNIITSDDFTVVVSKDSPAVTKKIKLKHDVIAPIKKGDTIGQLVFLQGNKKIGSVNLVSDRDVKRKLYTNWWFFPLMISITFYVFFKVYTRIK